jgi:hypothetical protein
MILKSPLLLVPPSEWLLDKGKVSSTFRTRHGFEDSHACERRGNAVPVHASRWYAELEIKC